MECEQSLPPSLSAMDQTQTLILCVCFSWILAEGLIGSALNYFSVREPVWCGVVWDICIPMVTPGIHRAEV